MKNQNKILLLILNLLLGGSGYAQVLNDQNPPKVARELSLKQQLAILEAGKNNPVKAQPLAVDDRMTHQLMATANDFGASNDKAQPLEELEQRPQNKEPINGLPESQVNPQVNESKSTQPIGVKSKTVVNYRSVSGGDTQSQPDKSENEIDYKSIKGGHEQPIGKVPEKLK